MPDFHIKITGDASSAVDAAKKSADALNKTASAGTESGKSTAGAMEEAAKALKQDGTEAEEVAKKTGFLSLKKGELKKLVRELGQEFPIAGQAAKAMMNPVMFSLTAAIGVFAAAKAKLEEWNQQMDEMGKRNASRDFLPGIEAKAQALSEAVTAANQFEAALGNIGKAEDHFKKSIQQAIDKLHEWVNAQAEINSAAEAKELADVDLQEKQGSLSNSKAITKRAEIRNRYRKLQDDLKTKGEQDELRMQEAELESDKKSQPSLEQAQRSASKRRDALQARLRQAQKDLEVGEKGANQKGEGQLDIEASKALEALDSAQAEAASARNSQGTFGRVGDEEGAKRKLAEAKEEADKAVRSRDLQRGLNDRNRALIGLIEGELLPYAQADATTAQSRVTSNKQRILELETDLPAKRELYGIREQGREVAGGLKDQTVGLGAAAQLSQVLEQGQQHQAQLQQQIDRSVQSHQGVTMAMLRSLEEVTQRNAQVQAEIDAFRRNLKILNQQGANRR